MGPTLLEVVRRRSAQHVLQLPRPPRRGRFRRPDRLPLGRRTGRHPDHQLRRPARRGVPVRKRIACPRPRARRPSGHLHADDPRTTGSHAGLYSHRGGPQRHLRGLLTRLHRGPMRGRRGPAHRHRGRRLPPRRPVGAEGQCGRRAGRRGPVGRARGGRQPLQHRGGHGRRSGPVVARRDSRCPDPLPGRTDGQRTTPLPAVHVGYDSQTQGDHAHHGRLPHPGGLHPPIRVRPPPGDRRLLVRSRHRLGHRPQLHRLRTIGQRLHVGHLRRHPGYPTARGA